MTATGAIRLDCQFTPPERVTGFRDCRVDSDLWSLGAVMYTMLTGHDPNELAGRDPITAILQPNIVPIRDRDRGIPRALAQAIDRSLAVDPGDRFHTAAEMRSSLRQAFRSMRGG